MIYYDHKVMVPQFHGPWIIVNHISPYDHPHCELETGEAVVSCELISHTL